MQMQFKNLAICWGFFILATISFVACGNADENKGSNSENRNTSKEEVAAVGTGATAGVSFTDQNGKTVSLSSLKGKVVFINFWATWCPPCIHEMPSINKLKHTFKGSQDIVFLMVDVDNKIAQSTAFMEENKYDLPVYVPASHIPSDYLGGAIPTTVILDKNGEMVGRMEGGRDYTDPRIIEALNELVEADQ